MLLHRETLYGNEVEQVSKHEQTWASMSKHAKFADFNRFNIFRSQMPETMYHQYKSTFGIKVEGKGGSEASSCENFDFVVEWCNKALK